MSRNLARARQLHAAGHVTLVNDLSEIVATVNDGEHTHTITENNVGLRTCTCRPIATCAHLIAAELADPQTRPQERP